MEISALLIWHYYDEEGKLESHSITDFTGNREQLRKCANADDIKPGGDRYDARIPRKRSVLQQIVLLP